MASERILVILKPHIGDAVMATPLIDGLLSLNQTVGVSAPEGIRRMLEAPYRNLAPMPNVRFKGMRGLLETRRIIREGKWDVALLPNRTFRSALVARLSGIPVRVGHAVDNRRFLLTHSIPYDWERSESESYLDLARLLGLALENRECKLSPTTQERSLGQELLCGATVGLQPGATSPFKAIPARILREVALGLAQEDQKLALLGGADEIRAAAAFAESVDVPFVSLVGKTDLRGTLGVLANLRAVVAGDTGLMHMAAAVSTPTVSLFGYKPASKWGHLHPPHRWFEVPVENRGRLDPQEFLAATKSVLQVPV